MTSNRYHNVLQDSAACFWTSVIVDRLPVLRSATAARSLLATLDRCRRRNQAKLLGYVIMPEHLHLLGWSQTREQTGLFIRQVLSESSKEISAMARSASENGNPLAASWYAAFQEHARKEGNARVWKERGRTFPVIHEKALLVKLEYMHNNPVRRGLVDLPESWEFSSAAWYAGLGGPLEMDVL